MGDGVRLAADLYRPDGDGPFAVLLEALPYRKDDLTAVVPAASTSGWRDEGGFAVCRVDLRGTGSSGGDATDEYPEAEQQDLAEVIAWLAAQPWSNGRVGMFGTSYSGFNSIQMACERPPALHAICAIYATDDRYTDDVHYMGGALRAIDLVDYCHYMTPMNALPPVPAVCGDGWREEWRAPGRAHGALAAHVVARATRRPVLAARLAPARLRAHRLRRRCSSPVGRRLPQQLLPHLRGAAGRPRRCSWGRGATCRRRRRCPDRTSTSCPRWSAGSAAGCATTTTASTPSRRSGSSCATPPAPSPTWPCTPAAGGPSRAGRRPGGPSRTLTVDRPGSTALDVRPDVGHRARGSPAPAACRGDSRRTSGPTTRGRSRTTGRSTTPVELVGPPGDCGRGCAPARRSRSSRPSSTTSSPTAPRPLVTRGFLNLTHRASSTDPRPLPVDEPVDVAVELEATAYAFAAGHRIRLAWPARTGRTPGPLRAR